MVKPDTLTHAVAGNHVYSLGATGILNMLDAGTGSVIWSRNAAADAGVKVPAWGFTSSPLVTRNRVIIALAGKMAAYDITTGDPVWFGPEVIKLKNYGNHLITKSISMII